MELTEDEKTLLKNYRRVREEVQQIRCSEFSTPACAFSVGDGSYMIRLVGEYIRQVD